MNKLVFIQERHSQWILSIYGDLFKNYEKIIVHEEDDIFNFDKNDIIVLGTSFLDKLILDKIKIKSKIILIDVEGEHWDFKNTSYEDYKKHLDEWLGDNNHLFISQRFADYKHSNSLTGKLHYSLFYYFSRFELFFKNETPIPSSLNATYDFITFLGKSSESKKIRFNFLNKIMKNDLKNCKYEHETASNQINPESVYYFSDVYNIFWNIIQSLDGKINIIFETISPGEYLTDEVFLNRGFLTEKTLRALITPNPSILLVNPAVINYFNKIGFTFPYKGFSNIDDVKKYIDSIKSYNVIEWCKENISIFENNSNNLWNIMFNPDTDIKKILNKLVN